MICMDTWNPLLNQGYLFQEEELRLVECMAQQATSNSTTSDSESEVSEV